MLQFKRAELEIRKRRYRFTHPKGTSPKRGHTTPKSRFLAFWCDPLIYALPQPYVRFHIPAIQQHFEVAREFDHGRNDIGGTVPSGLTRGGEPGEAVSCEDRRAFGECPDCIVLCAFASSEELGVEDSA